MRGAAERSNLPQEQGAVAGSVASHPGKGATDSVWQGISEALSAVSGGSAAVGGPPAEPAAASTIAEGHPSADASNPPAMASADGSPSGAAEAVHERSHHVQPLQRDSGATAAATMPAGAQESSEAHSESLVPKLAAVAAGSAFSSSELVGSSEHAGDQDAAAAGKVDESASACKQS